MKDLLSAIKTALRAATTYVRDRDIYITEDVRLIRSAGGYPAIGIKDNGSTYTVETSDQEKETMGVVIACYTQLDKPEAAIMGDPATGAKGLLDLAADILLALDTTFSGQVDMSDTSGGASPSELIIDERHAIQMLTLNIEYIRWK